MKRFLIVVALATIAIPALASDVGVSVSIGQPGFYGRIDIGNYPQPQLIYPAPVMVRPVPMGMAPQPIYVHAPPGHRKNWRKHCRKYDACGQPVYFVQDSWYNDVYVPGYREHDRFQRENRNDRGRGEGHGRGHDRD